MLKEAGLCNQAEISVQGEDEAEAKRKEQADKVDIHTAAEQSDVSEVQFVLDFYPLADRVNAKDQVTVPGAPLAVVDSVLVGGQFENTPLHRAEINHQCQVAEILIAA